MKCEVHRAKQCNIIYIVKPTRCTSVSNLFYFEMTLYRFQTVFPSIIRSSRLYIQQQAFVKQTLLSETCRMSFQNKTNLISKDRWWLTTDTAVCLLASRQQYLFDKCLLLYVQSWTPDDGRKDRPKPVECHFQNKINSIHWCILLVLLQKQSQNLTGMSTTDHTFAISMSCLDTKLKEKYYHSVHRLLKEMTI